MMTRLIFVILFGLVFLLCLCTGQISLPPEGDTVYALPGENVRIVWKIDVSLSLVLIRSWTHLPNNDSFIDIDKAGDKTEKPKYSPGPFTIEPPSTLIFNNVTMQYNGTYIFTIFANGRSHSSYVTVVILVTPMLSCNCSSSTTVNVTDNFICVCKASGGNPPADVTWYKGNNQIGQSKKGEQILRLINVDRNDAGTYRCEAKSHDSAVNETEIELIVNYPPESVKLTLTRSDDSANMKCSAEAQPPASFKIFLNETHLVLSDKDYTIHKVDDSHVGNYTCVAENILGSKTSNSEYLSLKKGPTQTTPEPTAIKPSPTQNIVSSTAKRKVLVPKPPPGPGPPVGLIVGIVIGVLVLLLIVCVVVYRYKKKEKEGGNRGNVDPNHYELENEDASPADNAYDTVGPVGTSSGKSKPPEKKNTLPPVYAAVDKNNRQGNTLYASLDTDAMKPKRESKKEPERTPQTEYASIDFAKRADDNVPKADLV